MNDIGEIDLAWIMQHLSKVDDRPALTPGETYAVDSNVLARLERTTGNDVLPYMGLVGAGLIVARALS